MLEAGTDLPTIQLLMGHERLEDTTVYLQLSRRHLQAAVNPLVENVIERAMIMSSGPELRVPVEDLSQAWALRDTRKPQTLEEAERAHILVTLKETDGSLPDRTAQRKSWD